MPAGGERGQSRRATLAVPATAPFFADHFPRRPVFPATLLLDAGIRLAIELASELPAWPAGTPLRLVNMTRVKVRSFTPPGQRLDLTVSLRESGHDRASIALAVSADEKSVATARVEIRAGAEENCR
jgi:3-hydroxymyristoyl/3-hydroxydecanoyl-(acyl carrier protein) dehydratase